jgi:hypothetical protein
MNQKKGLKNTIRGWFPQQPVLDIVKSAQLNEKRNRLGALPFLAAASLMLVAAILSAFVGADIVLSLIPSRVAPGSYSMFSYSNVYVEIIGLANFILGSCSAVLLLSRKRAKSATVAMVVVLSLWLTTPLAHALENLDWQVGLFAAWPLIALPILALLLTAFSNFRGANKLTFLKEPPSTRSSLVIVLGVSGGGLTFMSVIYGVITFFQYHIFPLAVLLMIPTMIFGVSLLVVTVLVRRKTTLRLGG